MNLTEWGKSVRVAPNEVKFASTWLWSSFSNLWRACKIIVEIHTQQNNPTGLQWRFAKIGGSNTFATDGTNERLVAAGKFQAAATKFYFVDPNFVEENLFFSDASSQFCNRTPIVSPTPMGFPREWFQEKTSSMRIWNVEYFSFIVFNCEVERCDNGTMLKATL